MFIILSSLDSANKIRLCAALRLEGHPIGSYSQAEPPIVVTDSVSELPDIYREGMTASALLSEAETLSFV